LRSSIEQIKAGLFQAQFRFCLNACALDQNSPQK
jgi:hypothetical protein